MKFGRYGGLVAAVAALGLLQLLYDDVLVFLAVTEDESYALASPYVLMAVSAVLALTLFVVLLAWALFDSGPLR